MLGTYWNLEVGTPSMENGQETSQLHRDSQKGEVRCKMSMESSSHLHCRPQSTTTDYPRTLLSINHHCNACAIVWHCTNTQMNNQSSPNRIIASAKPPFMPCFQIWMKLQSVLSWKQTTIAYATSRNL